MTDLANLTVEEYAEQASLPLSWRCVDCGFDTAPGNDTRKTIEALQRGEAGSFNIADGHEVYCVRSEVWDATANALRPKASGCLCIGCLEDRIGRKLTPADFEPGHAFHLPHILDLASDRLQDRHMTRAERRRAMRAA